MSEAKWHFPYSVMIKHAHNIQIQPSLKAELAFFFPHVTRAQRLAPARTRTWVVRLTAQLTTHVKSSALYGRSYGPTVVRSYGRKSKFLRLDGLLLPFCIIMGLRSASSAIISYKIIQLINTGIQSIKLQKNSYIECHSTRLKPASLKYSRGGCVNSTINLLSPPNNT